MTDRESPIPFTFFTATIGTDGTFRAVGRTPEAARATLAAEAEPLDVDMAEAYTATVTLPRSHAEAMVLSLFVATHGYDYARSAWLSIARE